MLGRLLLLISFALFCQATSFAADSLALPSLQHARRGPQPKSKALRLPMKQAYVNGTDSARPSQRSPVSKRGWGWKHLEDYKGYLYFIELELGNPTQTVKLVVDTGSFEMWINPNCTAAASPVVCYQNGHYDPKVSQYSAVMNRWFDFRYGTGFARGQYYSDSVYFRETEIAIFQTFGVANNSDYAISGIMGLGYGYGINMNYPSVLDSLVIFERINSQICGIGLGGQGEGRSEIPSACFLTSPPAFFPLPCLFSFGVIGLRDHEGEIVFGGVNRYKYNGYLQQVSVWPPLDQQPQGWTHYWVNMTSVGMNKPGMAEERYTTPNFNINVLIDTGSTLTYLRADIVYVIAQQFGAWDDQGLLLVDCSNRDKAGTVNFGFANNQVIIRVRYKDFVVKNQDGTCSLGVQVAAHDNVLGDTFIRGAYLVFDQTTDSVWMSTYKSCGDGVQETGTSGDNISVMKGFC